MSNSDAQDDDNKRFPPGFGRSLLITALIWWVWFVPVLYIAMKNPPPEFDPNLVIPVSDRLLGAIVGALIFNTPIAAFLALVAFFLSRWVAKLLRRQRFVVVCAVVWSFVVWLNPLTYVQFGILNERTSTPLLWFVLLQFALGITTAYAIDRVTAKVRQ